MQAQKPTAGQCQGLRRLGTLALNRCGDEVLLGLTEEETAFVLACSRKPPDARTPQECERLPSLMARHEQARMREECAGDAAKDESRLG